MKAKLFSEIVKLNKSDADIDKFNPYHDSRGRFTTSGVGASFSGTLLHGSPHKGIKEFDINRAGSNTGTSERMLFFTNDKKMADEFSYERLPGATKFTDARGKKGEVYRTKVKMKKPLDLRNLSDDDVKAIRQLDTNGILDDTQIRHLASMKDHASLKAGLDLTPKALSTLGYDGIIANAGNGRTEFAVIDSKQTKIIHKTFSEILKFNENHDNLGRFTSGSSAGAVAASNSPQKAYALSEENKAYLIAYTSGKYGECCSISQKLEQGENVDSHNSNDVKQTKEIMKAIDSQPVTDSELVRIETGSVDYNSGDTFTWGIRSTSRDTDFAKKVINQEDAGTENKLYTHDGRYLGMVEYHIVGGKKALDVSKYSDFDQKESLVKGKFKVLSVDKTEYKPPERKTFEQAAKENPSLKNRYEEFTSKKGNAMVRDNETGTSYTKDKFGKMVYHGGKMISDHEFDDMVYDHKRSFKPKTLVKVEQVL